MLALLQSPGIGHHAVFSQKRKVCGDFSLLDEKVFCVNNLGDSWEGDI